jgi:fatty-acyl-CoA synthase
VELAEGSSATQEQVLEWAKQNIGERAAIPKEINVIGASPLTAVGKIFKPALRFDATKKQYEEELKQLGDLAESVEVAVGEDMVHGTLAKIKVKASAGADASAIQAKVPEILSRYTVKYQIEVV